MNPDSEDAKLRERFHRLRQEDEQHAPSFAAVRRRALDRMGTAGRRRPAMAIAALGLIVLLGTSSLLFRQLSRLPPPATQLSEWRSPTDFLLKTPDLGPLNTIPRLGESLVKIEMGTRDEKK